MTNNWKIGAIAGLDGTQSRNQLNSDIKGLARNLDKLKLYAEIDKNQVAQLQNQLKDLQVQLNNVTISDSAINGLVAKINAGLQNINIGNINIGNQSQNVGQQIGNNIAKGIASGVSKAKSELKSFFDLTNFSELNKKIEHLQIDPSALKNYNAILDEVKAKYAEFGQVKITNEQFDNGILEKFKVNIEQVNGDLKETKSFMMTLNDDKDTFVFDGIIKGSESVVQHLDKTKNAVNQTADAINALKDKAKADKIQHSFENEYGFSEYGNQIRKIEEDLKRYGASAEKVDLIVEDLNQTLSGFKVDSKFISDDKLIVQADSLKSKMESAKVAIDEAKISYDKFMQPVTKEKASSLVIRINDFLYKNTNITNKAKDELQSFIAQINNGVNLSEWNHFDKRLKEIKVEMGQMGRLGKSMTQTFKDAVHSFVEWTTASGAVMEVFTTVRQGVEELKNLDNILTEISKTSDLTSSQLKELGNTAFESASKYGKSASDYLTGVQEMYRSGFSNASEMAEVSILAQASGDMDSTLANDYLLATNAAYKYKGSVEELTKVLNGQNYITNNAAISMKDIADATTETASVAAQYGVQIDELSALIATATANTRESGAEVGTALKSIMINLQDTTSKPVTETFDALDISMTKVVNGSEQLKTPIELIYELADAYNSLPEGDIMRANILNEIGQKRHANTLAAVLSDMDGLNHMLELYNSNLADNSAYNEAMKSANNWSGSLNKVKNSMNDLIQNFANSDVIIGALNTINNIIVGIDKLTEKVGTLGTIGIGVAGILGAKGSGLTELCYIS